MCHKGTFRPGKAFWLALLAVGIAAGQSAPDWRKIGGTSLDLSLAAPATGPVQSVWFSPDGAWLYARTAAGRVFETADFETWTPAPAVADPGPPPAPAAVERVPDPGARLVSFPAAPGRVYALGSQLQRSEDGGRSWVNLTAFKSESVIGSGQHAVALAPQDPEQIVVANDFGVWRSMDGGLSWSGLNQGLPGLGPVRIVAGPRETRSARMALPGRGVFELTGGEPVWEPATDDALGREGRQLAELSAQLGVAVTAAARSGDTVYAGSDDGRLWVSVDAGRSFQPSGAVRGGAVERIFVDPAEPRVALAALAGRGPHVLRTTNSGGWWDDLTSNLGDVPAHAVAADRAAGAVYVATDKGVFYARADLDNPGSPTVQWTLLTARLPESRATDVQLDAGGNQLYIALEGYGLYAAMAPHRSMALRLVNAADFSSRAAAPGSLVSVVGARVSGARSGNLNLPVLAASESESQIQVPFEASGPNLPLALDTARGAVRVGLPVQPVSPAIFVSRDAVPMLLDADSGVMLDPGNPARSGMRVQILATGLGRVRPDWPTGLAAPLENTPVVVADVKAWLDRVPVPVTRASLAPGYVGFYLIEIQLPAIVNAGPAELYLTAGGQDSNRVQVFLQP